MAGGKLKMKIRLDFGRQPSYLLLGNFTSLSGGATPQNEAEVRSLPLSLFRKGTRFQRDLLRLSP